MLKEFYKRGQRVRHTKIGEVLTVVRDEGGVKVVVRDKYGLELEVLRDNLVPSGGCENDSSSC
ncbi:hypothetical protein Hydth_0529 [Hydrogenobacter thermophilus TK-6]|nr:hypothetical protein Hydth_0529 [Hydrogenobacter thermophilus TK-6]